MPSARRRNIDQQVHNDRVANGGTLTGQERQQINREQNAASRQIYNENHNANTVKPNEVDNREANQQQRTANGLRSGRDDLRRSGSHQSQPGESRPAGPQRTHRQRRRTNARQKRQQVNREQNENSRQIYNEKHNAKTVKR